VNFDRVAPYYRWLEKLVFGRALEQCRTALLPDVSRCERALCIGDGDGRFTRLLLRAQPGMQVDVVERSRSMIRLARRRSNAKFFHANALTFTPDDRYDLIVTQFVLDTFTSAEVSALVRRVHKAAPGGLWIVSEFQPVGSASRLLIWLMYLFFRIAAGLHVQSIPDYRATFAANGMTLDKTWTKWNGFLVSELWRLP
jgi:SAM-dependent methyltransferase